MLVRPGLTGTHRVLLAVAMLGLAVVTIASRPAHAAAASSVSWSKCHVRMGPFECAKVRVPLDYDRPGDKQISIALTRLPATDPERRIGSLFLNPGGPGGSGVDLVVFAGQQLYTPEIRARFDLVGFDPRGIARSSGLRCFGTPKQWGPAFTPFYFPLTPEEEALKAEADRYVNHACEQRGTPVIDHMSTANVARDMDVLRRAVGDDKLSFAGGSYGSYVGVTYANMFPDRVRAVVVDGIIDPIGWSTGRGNEALTTPLDTRLHTHVAAQETLQEFFRLCDAAGSACAFSGGAADRFAALARRARSERLKFVFPDGFTEEGGYSTLIGITLGAMYSSTIWTEFAQLLADVEASPSAAVAGARLQAFTEKHGDSLYPSMEGAWAVMCEDSDNPDSYAAWSVAGAQADQSSYFGRLWTWTSSPCAEWKAFDEDRYIGPFDKATANPLLVVATRFDPSTPYEGAVVVDQLMPNSALLTINGWGHTSRSILSRCADEAIERYLIDIATPPEGATCEQDNPPFAVGAGSSPAARARVQALNYMNGRSPGSNAAVRRAGAPDRHTSAARAPWSGAATSAIDALGAQVAVDEGGNAVYAWSSSEAAAGIDQVQARRRSAKGTLGPFVSLSDPAAEAFDVRVAVNPRGAAVFSWREYDAANNVLTVKTRSWSARGVPGPIADVSDTATDALEHRIAIADAGDAVITWTSADRATGSRRARARSRSAAGALGPVLELGDPASESFGSQVAIDDHGVATFAWTQARPATRQTRGQTRTLTPTGELGPTTDLSDGERSAGAARVAVDGNGDAVFGWLVFDERSRGVVQTRSRSRNGTFGPIAELSDPTDEAWDPTVALDADGDAVFAWWIVGRAGARVETRSRSARGTIGSRVTLSDTADDGFEPQIAVDDDGDAVFTWLASNRHGVRVQARSRSPRGRLGRLLDLSLPAEDAFSAQVAVDARERVVFGWSALDGDSYRVLGRSATAGGGLGPLETISTTSRPAFDGQLDRAATHLKRISVGR
jgi:pimeloyl-ACP methyl ester carboxylesterase